MKKFFMFAAMASVALVSCVKNEPAPAGDQGDAIVFNSPVIGNVTKATEYSGVHYPNDVPFYVYAWYTDKVTDFVGTGDLYMNHVEVTYDGDLKVYRSQDDKYYWPKNGDLTFFAYSPTEVNNGTLTASAADSDGEVVLTYSVPTASGDQIDLLYSDWNKDQLPANYDSDNTYADGQKYNAGIDIAFNHALSVIKIFFQGTTDAVDGVRIQEVTLSGVKNTGSLTCNSQTPPTAWNVEAATDTYTVLAEVGVTGDVCKELDTTAEQYENFILLPQTLTGDVKLNIKYFIRKTDGWLAQNETIILNTATVTDAESNQNALTTWLMNTRYTYNVKIDVEEIHFAPRIKAWVDVTVDTIEKDF